jgi:preprotein translocase subunit SecA
MKEFIKTILNNRELKPLQRPLVNINGFRNQLEAASDRHLKSLSSYLIKQAREGVQLGKLLEESFALTCEASRRVLNLNPYDVQVMAAVAMHKGMLAQMQTGEGKTLAAVLPSVLNGLAGKGVHILTFNDYLARRDAEWMGPIYRFLGLTVGCVQEGMTIRERQEAYNCDITYLTAKEAGFDLLRDHRCGNVADRVHRAFNFTVVDEADSILIDEARVPLVIAGETEEPLVNFYQLAELVRKLKPDEDFYMDTYGRDVNYTEKGLERVEKFIGSGDLHVPENNQSLAAANLALQAEILLKLDVDYIIRQGKIELVDEFTGRVADKRRWPYGLQTAVEAKEGLDIQPDGMILGSITLQHFLQLYPKMAGMTATAKTSETEFETFYNLNVVEIPSNRPCIRIDHDDLVFTHKAAKQKALLEEIRNVHSTGRPILVGTFSVEESEQLAAELVNTGINCNVLNAKNDEAEAAIVAEAGAPYAVTISTNMAGRGTDIRLGGKNREHYRRVAELGGLYVIGTNRYESRRIDLQLRGRAGRQGDPGSTKFFISMEDDLMVRYRLNELIPPKHLPHLQDNAIQSPVVAREIARAQRIVDGQNFEIRKTLRQYSFMQEEQRKLIHRKRRHILLDQEPYTILSNLAEERYQQLLPQVGKAALEDVEKTLALFFIDQCWTEHLAYMSHIRQGIHLWGFSGKTPLVEFQKLAISAFDNALEQINERTALAFEKATITKDGIDMEKEGLMGPTSTWTYLINDNPFNNPMQAALIGSFSYNFAAGIAMAPYLPFILIGKLFKFSKGKQNKS